MKVKHTVPKKEEAAIIRITEKYLGRAMCGDICVAKLFDKKLNTKN